MVTRCPVCTPKISPVFARNTVPFEHCRASSRAAPMPRTQAYNHNETQSGGSVASRPAPPSRALFGRRNAARSKPSPPPPPAAPHAPAPPDRLDIAPPGPSAGAPAGAEAPPRSPPPFSAFSARAAASSPPALTAGSIPNSQSSDIVMFSITPILKNTSKPSLTLFPSLNPPLPPPTPGPRISHKLHGRRKRRSSARPWAR